VFPNVAVPAAPPMAIVVAAPKALTVVAVELSSDTVAWLVAIDELLRLMPPVDPAAKVTELAAVPLLPIVSKTRA
jgi:hypothetical protein